jgi:DNA (cytosine-5)-methyltransferase 1
VNEVRIGSTCSGYGGLELGLAAALGGRTVWHAEIDRAACRVLEHRWPGTPNHGDITTADWSRVEPVEVVAGGFPCQKVSLNGRRAGLLATDDGLWGTRAPWLGLVDAIRALRPRLVLIENVGGLLSAPEMALGPGGGSVGGAFGRILADLADLGFDAEWLCAGADTLAGAAHKRRRVFLLAVAADAGSEERARWARLCAGNSTPVRWRRPRDGAVAPSAGWGRYRPAIDRWARIVGRAAPAGLVLGPAGGLVASARFMEWHMGLPAGWVTDVPGVTAEDARRLLGNGVVPQQAAAAVSQLLPRLMS